VKALNGDSWDIKPGSIVLLSSCKYPFLLFLFEFLALLVLPEQYDEKCYSSVDFFT